MTKEARIYNEEKAASSINGIGKIGQLHAKNETGSLFYVIQKINLKWIKDLNVRPETINLLKENIGGNFFDIDLSNIFLDMFCQAKETKAKINY